MSAWEGSPWQQQGLQLGLAQGHSMATVELCNASVLLGKLKARRDELKRLLAAQEQNRIELAKVERMIEAAEQPELAP